MNKFREINFGIETKEEFEQVVYDYITAVTAKNSSVTAQMIALLPSEIQERFKRSSELAKRDLEVLQEEMKNSNNFFLFIKFIFDEICRLASEGKDDTEIVDAFLSSEIRPRLESVDSFIQSGLRGPDKENMWGYDFIQAYLARRQT
jgi:hypothetical protein